MLGKEYLSSYVFAVDRRYGWGNTSMFTFFSQLRYDWAGQPYVEAVFLSTLTLLSLLGNLFIIVYIARHKSARTITNYFVCNLALADILFVCVGPFISYVRITQTWRLGGGLCSILNYLEFVCGCVMIWTMAVISIDRYVCINLNLVASRRLKPWHVLLISVFIWAVAFAVFSPVAMYFHLIDVQLDSMTVTICTVLWPKSVFSVATLFVSVVVVISFVIPLVIISVNYVRIFIKFHHSGRNIEQAGTRDLSAWQTSTRSRGARRRRNIRTVNTLVSLVVLFVIMLLPLFIAFVLILVDITHEKMQVTSGVLIWTMIVAFSNACINPFLYGVLNGRLLKTVRSCCCVCGCCCGKPTIAVNSKQAVLPVQTISYQS